MIHVNRQFIAMNAKDGGNRPVFTTKIGRRTVYSRGVNIDGPSRLVAPGTQLKCGARAWIEADSGDVTFVDPMTHSEAKVST
jgi:hypothetical protein